MRNWILQARNGKGEKLFYTGRAGEGWVSSDSAEAWQDSEVNQMSNAARFNRYTALHGLTFVVVAL